MLLIQLVGRKRQQFSALRKQASINVVIEYNSKDPNCLLNYIPLYVNKYHCNCRLRLFKDWKDLSCKILQIKEISQTSFLTNPTQHVFKEV